jgi:hypothetical protein
MSTDTVIDKEYERTLVRIVRNLPENRAAQLVEFARFLEAQILSDVLMQDEEEDAIEAENARWDALLATDHGQAVLEKLAGEALAEHRAGRTRPMSQDDEGRISGSG